MQTSKRFTNAVTKLYNAFHKGELTYFSCHRCAVGNMCDNRAEWSDVFAGIEHPNHIESEIRLDAYKGVAKRVINKTGYSVRELAMVETTFYNASLNEDRRIDERLYFNGLCAVVEYLCELEGIPNVMDYKALFETKADQPKHKLEAVFAE